MEKRHVAVLMLALLGCVSPDATVPRRTYTLVVADGDHQTAIVGQSVSQKPTIQVFDDKGVGVEGVGLTFAVGSGGGSLVLTQTVTRTNGYASTSWQLGNTPGQNTITATATTIGTPLQVAFAATAVAGPPVSISKVQGDGQVGVSGNVAPTPLVMKLTDIFGNAAPGVQVNVSVSAGGGSVGASTAVLTNATGIATIPEWILGVVGTNQVTAVVASVPSLVAKFTVVATGSAILAPVTVNIQTTGVDIDPDGFLLQLTGLPAIRVAANGTTVVPGIPVGTYLAPALGNVSTNCELASQLPAEAFSMGRGISAFRVQSTSTTMTFAAHCVSGVRGRIVIEGPVGYVLTMLPDGTDLQTTPMVDIYFSADATISPDGARLIWQGYDDADTAQLWSHLIDSKSYRQLRTAAVSAYHPQWSPDGARIAFYDIGWVISAGAVPSSAPPVVRIMNYDGSGEHLVAAGVDPSFGPAGKLVWVANDHHIVLGREDGTISAIPGPTGHRPRWSPDGTMVAFLHDDFFGCSVLDVATGLVRQIARFSSAVTEPSWSPDGRRFVFGNGPLTYIANADGTGVQLITVPGTDPLSRVHPLWSPRP